MNSAAAIFEALMQLPEAERLEIAMAVLDQTAPEGMTHDEITEVAVARMDELESGAVRAISYEELVAGLRHPPRKPL